MAERPNCPHYTGTPGHMAFPPESQSSICAVTTPVLFCRSPPSTPSHTHTPFPDPLEVKSKSLTHYHIKFAYLCTALNLATGLSDENLLSLIVTRISFLSEALSLVERYAPQLYGKGYVSLHEPMPVGRPINECFQLFPEHWVLAREHYNLWPQRAHGCPAQSISGKAHKAAG